MSILSKYVCKNPFNYLDVQDNSSYICCPSWCNVDINKNNNSELGWNSTELIEVQKSVLDGSYRFCDKNVCPSLNTLINNNKIPHNFVEKNEFLKYYSITSIDDIHKIKSYPEFILFGFDRSCNLNCPSCRRNLIPNDKEGSVEYRRKKEILDKIESNFSKNAKILLITGSGDPFYSNIYREYLQNFDETKYPLLDEIKIITNGNMLNKKLWDSLKSKKYIKSLEISIDAGTRETYEKVSRLNGRWDTLIKNLKFINTIDTIKFLQLSFVVNEYNFHEMNLFYNLMMDIFTNKNKRIEIVYRQHVFWESGIYSKSEVDSIKIFEPGHPRYGEFETEFNLLYRNPNVNHNFNHLVKKSIV